MSVTKIQVCILHIQFPGAEILRSESVDPTPYLLRSLRSFPCTCVYLKNDLRVEGCLGPIGLQRYTLSAYTLYQIKGTKYKTRSTDFVHKYIYISEIGLRIISTINDSIIDKPYLYE